MTVLVSYDPATSIMRRYDDRRRRPDGSLFPTHEGGIPEGDDFSVEEFVQAFYTRPPWGTSTAAYQAWMRS